MEGDQVKYSDLFESGIVEEINNMKTALQGVVAEITKAKTEANGFRGAMSGMGTATREQQQSVAADAAAIDALNKKVKQLTDEETRLNAAIKKAQDEYNKLTEGKLRYKKLTMDEVTAVEKLRQSLKGSAQDQIAAVQAIDMQSKSYNELYQTYNALKEALNQMTLAERENSDAGKAMVARSKEIYDTLNKLQQATGKYTMNVGNYQSALGRLQFQTQQLMREAPSAISLQQFFLAISNNLPMFTDAVSNFKAVTKDMKARLKEVTEEMNTLKKSMEGMEEGSEAFEDAKEKLGDLTEEQKNLKGQSMSTGKALVKSIVSWQTAILVGIMLLQKFGGKIVEMFANIFKGTKDAIDETKLYAEMNEQAASTVGELTAKYRALQKEWQDLKPEDQGEWLEKHKNDWQELSYVIDDAKKAEDFYVNNTAAVQQAIDARARSMAGMKLAAEKYEEMFKLQVKADKAFTTMREMEAAGTAYEYRNERVRYIGNAATGSGTTITTPAGNYKTGAYAQAGFEYDMYKRQAEALRKEAEEFMKFVQPGTVGGSSGSGGSGKEPKDQVDDLLTLQRQLEDAIIANIEDEFEREEAAEIARHNRFIEDKQKELELVKGDAERTAVINQQIEEERNTHDRNMLDIDEKYRQQIIKGIEEQKKAEEQAAKEAEQKAKDDAKRRLDAEAQNWEKRRTEMVEQGKTRKEMLEAEFAAEIARLNIMKDLNRDVNGEKMSDEQRQKVEEWIRLLEQLQAAGNFRGIKLGSIFGKGASGLGGEKNKSGNYSNIIDLLFPDMTKDQQSALNSVFDQAKEALNSWMDARKAAADQAKELADDEVSAAENALNREIELRNQGYANNVALRERELADAKERQKKALEMQQKAKEEELAINTAMEASSMAVAIANLFKQFPIYVAIPLAATLLGAFSYAKLSALSQIRSTKYREGGVMLLEGGSHESGHDVNLGIGPDGSNLRAEGGEYFAVINKRNSRKYGSEIPAVVNALNSGMFEDRYIKTSDAVGLLPRIIKADDGSTVDLSAVESGVGELVKQGESKWTVEGEYRVERYKNRVRRVKIG